MNFEHFQFGNFSSTPWPDKIKKNTQKKQEGSCALRKQETIEGTIE